LAKTSSGVSLSAVSGLDVASSSNLHARALFDGIASRYDLLAQLLSFFQTGAWRRFLVSRLKTGSEATILDLCTGTSGVAIAMCQASGARVVGVDLSDEMLRQGQIKVAKAGLSARVNLLKGRAESLGFEDNCFDAVCFTYLLRYVDDPEATIREAVRVLKPGGTLLSLEFGVPGNPLVRKLWTAYTRLGLPLLTKMVSSEWQYVGRFLGPSIVAFYRAYPFQTVRQMWVDAGISNVQVKTLTFGGGVVMWGDKDQ
jgi:demethylmenaquinone methyltransferase/2-methoxy-6-polyprenyl-1,4-benzoquinol methylase